MRETTDFNYEKGQFLLLPWSVFRNRLRELVYTSLGCLDHGKV